MLLAQCAPLPHRCSRTKRSLTSRGGGDSSPSVSLALLHARLALQAVGDQGRANSCRHRGKGQDIASTAARTCKGGHREDAWQKIAQQHIPCRAHHCAPPRFVGRWQRHHLPQVVVGTSKPTTGKGSQSRHRQQARVLNKDSTGRTNRHALTTPRADCATTTTDSLGGADSRTSTTHPVSCHNKMNRGDDGKPAAKNQVALNRIH
jgi:hypothetical protein